MLICPAYSYLTHIAELYHDAPYTFIQKLESDEEPVYKTVREFIDALKAIDRTIRFDAEVLSGGKFPHSQKVYCVYESDDTVYIKISDTTYDYCMR